MKRSPPPYILWLKDQWRKSRKEKDPLKPKQPMSAFFAFTTEAMKLLEEEQYLQLKTKKEKDLLKPKQSMSTFFMFTNERRVALLVESKSVWEVAKIIGEEWKNMTERQKKHEKQNKEKYLEEMKAYKQRKEDEYANLKKEEDEMMKIHKQEALQLLKKKEKTDNIMKKMKENRQKKKKIADPNKPKKPASSFLLFRN
ncbi:High mobility group B protein 13 [Camellia lanceoleosa]|uniref:High mobility group B protein 13 n=1 Tax=Camellia lanceoleosa TaxID=1840588 RepID=A0ACC0IMI6_9ERIC|nr:High mobility group B protein 13 [Camellia lanceoleosa]